MNLCPFRRVPPTRWWLTLLVSALPWVSSAQTLTAPTPPPMDNAASATAIPNPPTAADDVDELPEPATRPRRRNIGEQRATAPPRFDIDLQASSSELREFLLRHLELQRFRSLRDLDANELARLLSAAPEDLRGLLGTLGYFSPTINIALLPADAASATDAPGGRSSLGTVSIRVEAGTPTRVATSQVFFKGDIATAPEAAEQRADIVRSGTLASGQPFTQADWDRAKTAALRELIAQRYPLGRIENSLADIDAATQTARLYIEIDSGAAVQVGAVRVEGSERYDPLMVQRLVRLVGMTPGSDYSLEKMQAAQRRLAESGYYDSVFVYLDPTQPGQQAPVVVQVRESLRQKVVFGAGLSTNSGARLSLEHTHHRVPGIGWRALNKLQLDRNEQLISSDWSAPVNDKGWRWIAGAQLARQVDGSVTTVSQRLRTGQSQETLELDRSFFLQYDRARVVNSALPTDGTVPADSALSANYAWTRRRFDDLVSPDIGQGLAMEIGLGSTLGAARRPFVRTQARWLGLWPVNAVPGFNRRPPLGEARPEAEETDRSGRLALRLQGGAVWAQNSAPVPETQLFLTGGDNTVRGYTLRGIGVAQADGSVSAGRYLGVASLEWQRPIWSSGARSAWESVVFVDAGAVANQLGDLRPLWGVGAGARYNSPVGPLQLDLAYGVKSQQLRLHLSVGFRF
jgi:translocation and assembly module TamA